MVDDAIIRAVWRARTAVGELNTSRRSEDIERVRKGVEYELERALRLAGHPWEGHQSPGPVVGQMPAALRDGHKGEIVAVDDCILGMFCARKGGDTGCSSCLAEAPGERKNTLTAGRFTVSREPIRYRPPCGKDDKHCGLRGGSAHCGGCRD